MNRFSIRDIENLTGIKAHTLRIWEQRYGILKPKRTATNIRYYDATDLKAALRISLLNNYGYKISHIHEMTESQVNNAIEKIEDVDFKLQVLVHQMVDAMLSFDEVLFESLIDKYSGKHGIEKTIEYLLFSFLEKIGLMWMADKILIAQEHFVSNIIYRKIALAIEKIPSNNTTSPKVLLFLPEGEIHEIGLLYAFYLLKKFDKCPFYLGANSPLKEVQLVADIKQADYLYVHLTSVTMDFDCHHYLSELLKMVPDTKILVSGSILSRSKLPVSDNLKPLFTLKEAREAFISLQ